MTKRPPCVSQPGIPVLTQVSLAGFTGLAAVEAGGILRAGTPTMIEDTIAKIEQQLHAAQAIKPERREELLRLLATLKAEVSTLSHTHGEEAASIAKFAEVSTHEAFRTTQNQQLLELSLEGLRSSAREFENSHPKLTQVINAISHTLSSLGI